MAEMNAEVEKVDSSYDIYSVLKNQIVTLSIEPGEMLSENSLSAQMNAGRPMVRDALARLTEEGYIVVYPQRGTVVTCIDQERVRQSVHAHTVLEQAIIEEICRRGLSNEQRKELEDALRTQKLIMNQSDALEFLTSAQHIRHLLSVYCGKEQIWELFRTMDCDLLRVDYLQYSTFNYKIYMSSLTSWEHTQVEGRMLVDTIIRGDAEAASLICSGHYNGVLWNMDTLRGIYPQFFSG